MIKEFLKKIFVSENLKGLLLRIVIAVLVFSTLFAIAGPVGDYVCGNVNNNGGNDLPSNGGNPSTNNGGANVNPTQTTPNGWIEPPEGFWGRDYSGKEVVDLRTQD